MKVTLPILQRVFEIVQGNTNEDGEDGEDELDPESHLFFIDAFDMPLLHWSSERSTFERYVQGLLASLQCLMVPGRRICQRCPVPEILEY